MYSQFPTETKVQPMVNGEGVEMNIVVAKQVEPERVVKLLNNLGWKEIGICPDTGESLYQKSNPNMGGDFDSDLANYYWRWYEAMAYEFGKFINIGLDAE